MTTSSGDGSARAPREKLERQHHTNLQQYQPSAARTSSGNGSASISSDNISTAPPGNLQQHPYHKHLWMIVLELRTLANSFTAFKVRENRRLLTDKGLVARHGGVGNQVRQCQGE